MDLERKEERDGLRGIEQGRTGISIYYMRKEPCFNKRKKENNKEMIYDLPCALLSKYKKIKTKKMKKSMRS